MTEGGGGDEEEAEGEVGTESLLFFHPWLTSRTIRYLFIFYNSS